jgi:hypothetical protein
MGCNEATLAERLEDTIESVLQTRISYELSYGRNEIENSNLQNDSPHRISKYEYVKSQDNEPIDRNVCRIMIGHQQEIRDLERKIAFLFAEGMSIREISEYIQSLFDVDAHEYFVNSSK